MTLVAALSRNEGFGLTVLEAMASGSAVIASHAGAWKDIIIDGEHGALVPCDNLEKTQERLIELLQNPTQLEEMGQRGRSHVEQKYSIAGEGKSLADYYRHILNS